MAPTLYHYLPVPMNDHQEKLVLGARKLPGWLKGLLYSLPVVALLVVVIALAVLINSEPCKNGLQAEQKCRNITHLLEGQLTRAQDVLLETEAQAATCNRTVVTLMTSLKTEKAQGEKQQQLVQELQEKIQTLKQELQAKSEELQAKSWELEQLRRQNEDGNKVSTNSGNIRSPLVVAVPLILSLLALLA